MLEKIYEQFLISGSICTDTRELQPGDIYVAWKGELSDGNSYVQQAFENGASMVVVDDNNFFDAADDRMVLVQDGITLIQELARHHRIQFDIPVIGIAGSNGKTTTKELIAAVLGSKKNIVVTQGNLNNHVGVPKTLLDITGHTEVAIIEMGANHVGELALLCDIARPTHGVVTNVGRDHIGMFGGFEKIITANTEMYEFLRNNNGQVFVDNADQILLPRSEGIPATLYGSDTIYEFISTQSAPCVSGAWKDYPIETNLVGEYNKQNIETAIAVGDHMGIDEELMCTAIADYQPNLNRSEIHFGEHGNTIIKDFYNANRTSMEAAIRNLAQMETDLFKLIIVGDMFELGEYEAEDHQAVVEFIEDTDIEMILVGKAFSETSHPKNALVFGTTEKAIEYFSMVPLRNRIILLKASNGMNFKKLFAEIEW